MSNLAAALLSLPPFLLLLLLFLPTRAANRHVSRMMPLVTRVAALNTLAAFTALTITLQWGGTHVSLVRIGPDSPISVSTWFDGLSSLMLLLVASLGWVICRFSIRYLDGESQQGSYFRWTGFTIGAVSLFVIAGNLGLTVLSLLLASIGLHCLLVHYPGRPAAERAASTKFVFSRLGDLCLAAAAVLVYREFGTLELPEIFAAAGSLSESAIETSGTVAAIGWLLILSAMFKSAQFPFHTWLPETMEAPTPVSALMHAGIVNAGGYLLIRMSPVLTLAPTAMFAVAGLGALTAVFAAVVMLSQSSVKQTLAWSTIAQMGFMILQCGLGAFSAATLHMIVHALYKAHTFLSSGSVMNEHAAMAAPAAKPGTISGSLSLLCLAGAITGLLFAGLSGAFDISLHSKPGGYALGMVVCLGLTRWMWQILEDGLRFVLQGVALTTALICVYLTTFTVVDLIVAGSFGATRIATTGSWLLPVVAGCFLTAFFVELLLRHRGPSGWLQRLYVHSSNGFYVDTVYRQMAKSFSS